MLSGDVSSLQIDIIFDDSNPKTAAIDDSLSFIASIIMRARSFTIKRQSFKDIIPLATSAEYSPRL